MANENKIRIRFVINDDEAKQKLQRVSQQLMEMGEKVMRLGSMMSMAVTAPIVGSFAAAVRSSEDLQKALEPIKTEAAGIAKEFGDALVPVIKELMPDIKKVLGYVSDLVKKFSELDTDSKERIVKLAIAIAAIGPALMMTGQLISFVGILGRIGSTLGLGAAGAGAGGAGAAAAGGGVTAAITGFGTALGTVILPLTAVAGLAFGLYKILEKIGAIKAAGQTLKDLGAIIRYSFGSLIGGKNVDPAKLSAFTTQGMAGLGYANGGSFTVPSGFPNDSFPLRVSSGERVNISPQGKGGAGIVIQVSGNIIGTVEELANAIKPAVQRVNRQMGLA